MLDFLKFSIACAVLCTAAAAVHAADVTVQGYIGAHRLSFKARSVSDGAAFSVRDDADYLAITEIYPDTPERLEYRYAVSAPGVGMYPRAHRSEGFGPLTYLIRVARKPVGEVRFVQEGEQPVLISRVTGVTEADLGALLAEDRFVLMGLVPGRDFADREKWMEMLAKNLPSKPDAGITTGFSTEIYYANRDRENVRDQLRTCMQWAEKYKLPAMLGLVSWWAGTPLHAPDGQGGKFGDLKYQQVCYSPDVEVEENPDLKTMLGDRYNRHYGLSVPNQWSSTPWLTMNSDALNRYRYARLDEAAEILKALGDPGWISSIYLENEPRYWDTACEEWNPKAGRQGKTLWADFNPLVTDAARKDGVNLDPADGLSNEELAWLHRNVGKYNQEVVDAFAKSLAKHRLGQNMPIYTHSLQHRDMFPCGPINHPASEWAYAKGARTGIEGMWSLPSDFNRLRDWGPWSNLNREENDGHHTDYHLWDLRASYMMGADLYNSYNWHTIGAERFFDYVREFVTQYPVVTLPPFEVKSTSALRGEIRLPMKMQAISRIELPLVVSETIKGVVSLSLESPTGGRFQSDNALLDLGNGSHTVAFDFATPAEVKWGESAEIKVSVLDEAGHRPRMGAVRMGDLSVENVKLSLDLRTQRALSLAVISAARP